MNNELIIFVKGPLETLNYFVDCISKNYANKIIFDITSDDFFVELEKNIDAIDEETMVILFNNVGLDVSYRSDGLNIWERKGVKLYNILVDNPVYFQKYLADPIENMNVIVVDQNHKKFVEKYYPKINHVFFLPHGGSKLELENSYRNKDIDVLYVGSCQREDIEYQNIDFLPDCGRQLYIYACDKMFADHCLEVEDVLNLYLTEHQLELSIPQMREISWYLHSSVERVVRRAWKLDTIRLLAANHISVEIYGDNWSEAAQEYPNEINVHTLVSSEECIKLMTRAKIVLNFMPWFKDGSHERIYNAMLNGAVCVTDESKFLKETLQHGQDIVFFKYHELESLVANIQYLLNNENIAENITLRAKERAKNETWEHRLETIINVKRKH